MADRNTVYDDPGTGPDLGPGRKAPASESADPRGNLRNAEQGGGSGGNESGAATGAASPSDLKDNEESGQGGTGDGGLYNAEGDNRGRFGRARNRARNARSGLRKLASHKWLAGGALGGIGIIGLIIIIIVLLAGAYKVVDFAEHVAAYQFARVTRQMAESTDAITAEKIGVDVADKGVVKSTYDNIKSKYYDTATGKTKDLWSKFDNYRPQKIISNFQHDGTLQFNYRDGRFGRQILDSVTMNGAEVGITRGTVRNLIPGYKFAKNVSFSRDFAPNLNNALKANDIGPITRARVASQIRSELNVSLVAWAAGRFAGKTDLAAALEIERESVAAAEGKQLTFFERPPASEPVTGGAHSSGIDAAATDVKDKLNTSLADDKQAAAIVDNPNQTPAAVAEAIANDASSVAANGLQGAIGSVINAALSIINPVYKYAVPLCLIYDGSIQKSGPSIDTQSNQLERSAVWVQSASAQQKDGFNASAEAVGGTNWKLGDVTKSNAEMRANGSRVNTSTTLSTQASPTGQYTYTIADYLGPIGNVVDTIGPICPALTNIWVGVGLGAANIAVQVASLFTGGEATAIEAGGEAAVDAELATQLSLFDASEFGAAAVSSSSFLSRQVIRSKAAGSFAKDFAIDTTKQVIAIGSLTLLARQLVAAEMGGSHSPTATDQSFNNGVDAGTNIYANQTEQRQFYGAPMSDSSLTQDDKANKASLVLKENHQNTYNRYLAVNNPNSLLSRAAIMASGYLNRSFFASLFKLGGEFFNPLRSLGSALSPLINQTSFADPPVTSANTYYGNVQFGYTPGEENLMNDPKFTYGDLLANQYTLDQSGKEDEIDATYGKCFTESIGEMLSNGDIKRDQDGNVRADDSLCSPKTLGPHNPTYGDLVFRWRLAHNYNNTLDQLGQMQEVTKSDGSSTGLGPPSGNAQQLAQQILANNNITYDCGSSAQQDIQLTAQGKPGTAGAPIDKAILQLIATIGQNHKVCVSALESYGQHHSTGSYHYTGDAVDFGSVDGVRITGRNAPALTIIKIAEGILPNGSAFGQWHDPDTGALCGPVISLPNSFDQFDDSCDHLHVQVPREAP
jgi:hypothetical protein